jgi:formylglycine-generating enzyme required for sulfatase activity
MPQPYKLFTIYAREDAQYLEELRGQLRPLEHAGRIKVWSDREINPGVDWEQEIVHNLDSADIILILVSAAYYNSAYIHDKEIKHAISRHERGEAKVLPVIVRPCSFPDDPVISRLQVLPTDGKPVTSHHWRQRDEAWLDVVAGVKKTLSLFDAAVSDKERAKEQAQQATRAAEALKAKEDASRLLHEQEQIAWQQTTAAHLVSAYENYLARYPQGEYAREARARIKTLKKTEKPPFPLKRYAAIGGGGLALLLAVWLAPKMLGEKHGGPAQSQLQAEADTPRVLQNVPEKGAAPLPVEVEKGSKTISPSSLPENVTVGKQKEDPAPTQPDTRSRKSGLEMVRVAGGAFTMGSPESETDRSANECQHEVSVGSFSIGKYEVTQADWHNIMGSNPSGNENCDDCPVEQVSWNDIQEFLKKLNKKYPGKNYRLPTEAEWEYAARGGKAGSITYLSYSGSNDLGTVAWYVNNSGKKTHPVGGKKPNQLGLYDMSGNVWEWCQDTWKPYPCDKKTAAEGRYRVRRGGSAFLGAANCRAADRDFEAAPRKNLGFRLVSVSLQ